MDDKNDKFTEPVIVEFYIGVTRCHDGRAFGSNFMNQRGHIDWPEITVWPKNEHYRLTTGGESSSEGPGVAVPVRLNETEKKMVEILGISEIDLGLFLRDWTPQSATDVRKIDGKKYVTELGPEGRPKSLDDLIAAYNRAGRYRLDQYNEGIRKKPTSTEKKKMPKPGFESTDEMVAQTTDDAMLAALEKLNPKDYTRIVEYLQSDQMLDAVKHLRFYAENPLPDLAAALYFVKLIKRFESL